MLTKIKQRLDREDEGFTLIELMVVVLIIAILLAIAIPTFLGARGQANSRAAQSTLRNALTAEQTYYTNNQSFGDSNSSPSINSIEQNIGWTTGDLASADPNSVTVVLGQMGSSANDTVYLEAFAKDGNCYTVWQSNAAPDTKAATGYGVVKSNAGKCTAPSMPADATGYPQITPGNASQHVGGGLYTSW